MTQEKYKGVKLQEDIGSTKINNFYRERNEESLAYYLQRIKQQQQKKKEELKNIKNLQKHMQQVSQKVESKKKSLTHIQQEIYKLKTNTKTLKSGTKIRRKTHKEDTEESEPDRNDLQWKDSLNKLINPEDLSDLI